MAWSVDEVRTYSYNGTNGLDGSVQNETLDPGVYKLECWGAQGGTNDTSQGFGGYVTGELEVVASTPISIYVGGHPGVEVLSGGWPNGGAGITQGYGTGGGGSSDIRLGGTALTDRIIVGGAGGGNNTGSRIGGNGGGLVGGNGNTYPGYGGTQDAGGAANGAFGVGGNRSGAYASGGGGGWYGGGGGQANFGTGGGGSSYYGTLANASTTTGVKTSHGEVKITMLSGGGPTPTTPNRRFAQII